MPDLGLTNVVSLHTAVTAMNALSLQREHLEDRLRAGDSLAAIMPWLDEIDRALVELEDLLPRRAVWHRGVPRGRVLVPLHLTRPLEVSCA